MRLVIEYSCDQGLQAVLDRSLGGEKTGLGFAFLRSVMDTCILLSHVIRRHGKPADRGSAYSRTTSQIQGILQSFSSKFIHKQYVRRSPLYRSYNFHAKM